ncbi:hypothetical protein VN12_07005 [Pirellula sp. SH-Sr6A]|nr:hypothetical protein VN12_07005 [Pirellula sp. SH-Sr6A]
MGRDRGCCCAQPPATSFDPFRMKSQSECSLTLPMLLRESPRRHPVHGNLPPNASSTHGCRNVLTLCHASIAPDLLRTTDRQCRTARPRPFLHGVPAYYRPDHVSLTLCGDSRTRSGKDTYLVPCVNRSRSVEDNRSTMSNCSSSTVPAPSTSFLSTGPRLAHAVWRFPYAVWERYFSCVMRQAIQIC